MVKAIVIGLFSIVAGVACAQDAAQSVAPVRPAVTNAFAQLRQSGFKLSPEQIAASKARFSQYSAKAKQERDAKFLAIIRKYVPEDEKATALLAELKKIGSGRTLNFGNKNKQKQETKEK